MYALFAKGGPLMWPLLLCSVVSVTITVERVLFWLKAHGARDDDLLDSMFLRTEAGDFGGALDAGDGTEDYAAGVLAEGLAHREHGLTEAMQVAAQRAIERMKLGLNVLDTIITLAPLLGILGTVLGIIESFDFLGQSGIEDPRAVTGGIAQALITTAAGLSVAIVTLIPFNYLVGAVQHATGRLESFTTRFEVAYRKGLVKANAPQ